MGLAPIAVVALFLYTLWIIYPVFASTFLSFTDARTNRQTWEFVGFDNYTRMLADPRLKKTFVFTGIVTVAVTLISNVAGVIFAMLLNTKGRNAKLMRTLAFIPQVLSGVVVAFIWRLIFNQNGLLNLTVQKYGWLSEPVNWLGTTKMATFVVCVTVAWGSTAFCTVIYTAGLQSVPDDLLEAARVDGAGELRVWWSIVMPLLRPATISVAIFVGLWSWNDFLQPLILLGPLQGQTITVAMYLTMGSAVSIDYGQVFAIMLLSAVIPIVAYLFCQREFVSGLAAGATKG
jgi:ABC-type sugar transport system permease subunit